MPRLESFRWINMDMDVELLRALYAYCPRLKVLQMNFSYYISENLGYREGVEEEEMSDILRARDKYGKPEISLFTGLAELSLHGVYDELEWWQAEIVTALHKNAATLKHVELSLSRMTCGYACFFSDMFKTFFDDLCDQYGALPGAKPLLLEHLVMHEGIYAYRRASLCKLLDPLRLISLRVYNDKLHDDEVMTLIDPYPSREWDQACGIPFDVFGPKGSPHFRQFTIARLEFDVYDMLRRAGTENPAWTRKLAVFCGRFISGFEFPGLLRRGVHFRMLNLDLERTYFHKVPLCDDDSGEELPIEKIPSVEQVLQELVKGDNGTLEGLSIRMADSKLPHHGKLPSLENTQLLATYLAQLSGLAQLDVMHTWVEKAETEAKEIAHLLAEAAPALQYIRNPYAAWRVYREPADGTGDEARAVVRLEPLDEAEIDDIELFKYSIWDPYYG
ncbi:hypothetical protein SEUCBS139899_007076 [Sporothrix eucalyptigena]